MQFAEGDGCDVGGPAIFKKIATVAVQVKTAAEDLNRERLETGSCKVPGVPIITGCFTACARKQDRSADNSLQTSRTRKRGSVRKMRRGRSRTARSPGDVTDSSTGSLSDSEQMPNNKDRTASSTRAKGQQSGKTRPRYSMARQRTIVRKH